MMEQKPAEGSSAGRKIWLVIACAALFLAALFWSVDVSIIYIFAGVGVFALFNYIRLGMGISSSEKEESTFEYDAVKPSATWLFWQTVTRDFQNKLMNGGKAPVVIALLFAGIVGFIIFIAVLSFIFGSDDAVPVYSVRAAEFQNAGQYDSAAHYYRLAIQEDPENAQLHYDRGNAFLYMSNNDSALHEFNKALYLQPQFADAQYNKGYIYFAKQNYRDAILEAKAVQEYEPSHINSMLLLGDCHYYQNELDSALMWYERAYATGYSTAVLCHFIAYIHDVKGRTDKAIEFYKLAIEQDESIVDIYARLGELLPGDEGKPYRDKAAALKAAQGETQ